MKRRGPKDPRITVNDGSAHGKTMNAVAACHVNYETGEIEIVDWRFINDPDHKVLERGAKVHIDAAWRIK